MEVSAVIQGSFMDVTAEMEVETTVRPTPQEKVPAVKQRLLRMRKIVCAEKEPGPPKEAAPQYG